MIGIKTGYQRYLCVVLFFHVSLLPSMNVPLSSNSGTIMDTNILALKIALHHSMQWFSHAMLDSLVINNALHKFVVEGARGRKDYFMNLIMNDERACFILKRSIVWHKYGSACGAAWIEDVQGSQKKEKGLVLGQCCLMFNGEINEHKYVNWIDTDISLLPRTAFFKNKNNFCAYGVGKEDFSPAGRSKNVIQYSCVYRNQEIIQNSMRCVTQIINTQRSNSVIFVELLAFIKFPDLLQAFLDSSIVYETETHISKDTVKVFAIKGVKIPDGYQKGYKNFKFLHCVPGWIRNAINDRYNTQFFV